jgi:predicted ATP-grasp superfamily ATP-dependent carboligase
MNTKNNLVIVLGASATALAVVRELAQLNNLSIIVACQEKGTACASKYIKEYWCDTKLSTLVNKIQKTSLEFEIALIPSSDVFVEWICNNQKKLSNFCRFDKCYSSQLALDYLDKNHFSKIIKSHGKLDQPNTYTILEFELMTEEQKCFPIFIKPKIIHKKRESIPGQKGIIVQNIRTWNSWYKSKNNEQQDWLIQEIIAGSENNIMLFVGYIGSDNDCTKHFTARKLRQYPAGF